MSDTVTNLCPLSDISNKLDRLECLITAALDAAEVGIWIWFMDRDEIQWDTRMFEIFGKYFDGKVKSFANFIHPEDLEVVNERVNLCIDNGIIFDCNYRIKSSDGWKIVKGRGNIKVSDNGDRVFSGICVELNSIAEPSKSYPKEAFLAPVKV